MIEKIISLLGKPEKEPVTWCEWCDEPIMDESNIYKIRGDYVCRECVERMYEERED